MKNLNPFEKAMLVVMYLLHTAAVKTWSGINLAWVWLKEFWIIPVVGGLLGGVVVGIVVSFLTHREQSAWIAAGICTPGIEKLYTPPDHAQCTSRNKDGGCVTTIYIPQTPYLRTAVHCEGQKPFWRKTTSLPISFITPEVVETE